MEELSSGDNVSFIKSTTETIMHKYITTRKEQKAVKVRSNTVLVLFVVYLHLAPFCPLRCIGIAISA